MKFVYSLQSVLEYRQQLEDIKKEKYIEVSVLLNVEKSKLETTINELEIAIAESVNDKKILIDEQKCCMNFIVSLQKKIEGQRLKIEEIEKMREKIREELEVAMKERKIMESLGEKELERYITDLKRKEEKELNDIAIIGYVRQSKMNQY